MAGRTAGDIFAEALQRNRSLPQIHALAAAIERDDLKKLVDSHQKGEPMPAWVTCQSCRKLVPMGKEHWRKNRAHCEKCYRAALPKGDDDAGGGDELEVPGKPVLEPAAVPGEMPGVPAGGSEEPDAVPDGGSEDGPSADAESEAGGDVAPEPGDGETAGTAGPPVRKRPKWY